MVFADLFFLYFFLPLCLICYFITRNATIRNLVLIVFSMIFYAWGEPVWVSVLLVSALVNYINGRVIGKNPEGLPAKLTLAWSLIFNLGLLFGFKYAGVLAENMNAAAGTELPVPRIALPIGISFYTLQTISYTVDCYRGKVEPQRSFLKFLMYVSMFPKLMAGPIVRYADIAEEIEDRKTTIKDFSEGFSRIILGIGKKALIANSLIGAVTALFGDAENGYAAAGSISVLGTWYGAILVGLMYYFDFSGYSDIAIGLGRIFGFHFEENFRYPFISRSISEFWQRWHISLSAFFRDYVQSIPVFGKKLKYVGLILVCLLMGLWHGASLNFVIWGLYFGFFIAMETLIGEERMKKIPEPLAHIYTKLVIFLSFGIFYFESLPQLGAFFKGLVGLNGNVLADTHTSAVFMGNIFLFAAAILFSAPVIPKLREKAFERPSRAYIFQSAGVICNALILLASSLLLLGHTNYPFLYYRF